MRLNLAASFLDHSIEGRINTPKVLEDDGIDIFDRKEQSRLLTARPTEKVILGASYDFDPLTCGVTGIYFGSVTWQHAGDAAFDQTFSAKVLTDLFATLRITNDISFTVSVNNLFDVFPDVIDTKGDFVTDLGGRFKYPWEVNQFGFNGRIVLATVNFTL